mmetsp:Transcript_23712/g.66963  ORF Transcript_23712/g.66963 Transcript_23712/m.66963 type:complete len:321 (-) Transcript_23712:637-1599(-)
MVDSTVFFSFQITVNARRHLAEDSLLTLLVLLLVLQGLQLLDQLLLLLAQILRNFDVHGDVMISPIRRWAAQSWCSVALQTHDLSRLGARRDFDGDFAVDDGRLDGISQNGIDVADGLVGVDFGSLATELRIRLHSQEDVQISRRATVRTGITFASDSQLVAVVHARRDGDLNLLRLLVQPLSSARSAVLLDLLSGTAAGGARLLRLEVTQRRSGDLHGHAGSAARWARGDLAAWLDAGSCACVAGFQMPDADLLLATEDSSLKVDLQIEPQIISSNRSSGPATAASSATRSSSHATAEEGIEDVTQIHLLSETGPAAER